MRRVGTAWRILAVFVSSFLLACAFPLPPFLAAMEGPSAAWLALIPLILLARLSRPRAAFWWGWGCGLLFWLVSAAWILQLRLSWGNLPLVILAWLGLAAYCALYVGLFTFLLSVALRDRNDDGGFARAHPDLTRFALVLLTPVL